MTMATQSLNNDLTTFDDYLRYGTDEEPSKGEKTRKAYRYTISRFLEFCDGRQPTTDTAREFVKSLEEAGNSPSSINRHIWALKSYFRFHKQQVEGKAREGGLTPNTREWDTFLGQAGAQDLRLRGLVTKKYYPRFLRDKEWDKLVKTANDTIYDPEVSSYARLRAKLELALVYAYGGAALRLSEAIALQEDDIVDEGYLRVTRKGGREDFVPVEDEVIRGIRDYVESRGQNGTYIFTGKAENTPMAPRTAQGIVKNLCRRAGLPDVHVHSLRHTAGYQLRKLGASERDIQDVLGHQNIQTTQIYTHLVAEDLRKKLPKRFAHARQGKLDWK